MKRLVMIASIAAMTLLLSNLTQGTVNRKDFSESFPPVVCPATPSAQTSAISLPSTQTGFRILGKSSNIFKPARTLRLQQGRSPTILDTRNMTSPVWQIKRGVWAGATICSAPSISQWFVGGNADVSSKGKLFLINSGLSEAIVDVGVWSEAGIRSPRVITLKANSSIVQTLASLDPGSKSLTIHVSPRSGRVNAFLIDERGRGLRALGGDIVNATTAPSNVVVIPAIPQIARSGKVLGHKLRLLAPGDLPAQISVELISPEGSFVPFGFDERTIQAGIVTELDLKPKLSPGTFALRISSDIPIIASVYSSTFSQGKSDFVWSTATDPMGAYSLAVNGLAPLLSFTGDNIAISLTVRFTNKKEKTYKIEGDAIATFRVPDNARTVVFNKVSGETHGGALIATQSGYGFFPLIPGSQLTRVLLPSPNIRVLNP
ncbi:MAG: DUF5719 family protein [Actinomycetota bacterium]|nr:DUF5719 family protein [Actinomycetota bacterium]